MFSYFKYNNKACYFQRTCIEIKIVAKTRDTNVLGDIPSLKNIPTNKAYIKIPTPKPMKRAGHIVPSKYWMVCFVAQIYTYEIGMPNNAKMKVFF